MKRQTQYTNVSLIGHTRWNADGHPMQYDIEDGHRHYLYWDGLGNHLYTLYETAVTPPADRLQDARGARPCARIAATATSCAAESDTPLGIKESSVAFYGGELRL